MNCSGCGCQFFILLGALGNRYHYRCRDCGLDCSRVLDQDEIDEMRRQDDANEADDIFDNYTFMQEI